MPHTVSLCHTLCHCAVGQVLDVYPSSAMRLDGHRDNGDCLHYRVPSHTLTLSHSHPNPHTHTSSHVHTCKLAISHSHTLTITLVISRRRTSLTLLAADFMMLTGAGAGAWADASLEPVCFADVPHCVTPGLMSHCVNAGIGAVLAVALCWWWRCAGAGLTGCPSGYCSKLSVSMALLPFGLHPLPMQLSSRQCQGM